MVKALDSSVTEQAISTIVFLSWVVLEPKIAPTEDFLRTKTPGSVLFEKTAAQSTEEQEWDRIISDYGFSHIDDFAEALLTGIKNGTIEVDSVEGIAKNLHQSALASKGLNAFGEVWDLYQNSFDNNQEEFLEKLSQSFKENFMYISPTNLSGTVTILKDLGRTEQAAEIISHYVANRADPRLFDLSAQMPPPFNVTDPDVTSAFEERLKDLAPAQKPIEILLGLAERDQFNPIEIAVIANLSPAEIEQALRSVRGDTHRRLCRWCMKLRHIEFQNDAIDLDIRRLRQVVEFALDNIAAENPLNRLRIMNLRKQRS